MNTTTEPSAVVVMDRRMALRLLRLLEGLTVAAAELQQMDTDELAGALLAFRGSIVEAIGHDIPAPLPKEWTA